MKKTFLFLADGFEELEAIAVVDVLRRGGVEVFTVSVSGSLEVESAHRVRFVADLWLNEVDIADAECLIFPGGMPGAAGLAACGLLADLLQKHYDRKGLVAAICAAPALVLSKLKTGRKLNMTCYPGFENYLPDAVVLPDGVVVDDHVITAKGPGFAVKFGLTILERMMGKDAADNVAAGMLL